MQTALIYAAKEDSCEVANYLITELHAYKEVRDYKSRTPLFIASEFSKRELNILTSLILLNSLKIKNQW